MRQLLIIIGIALLVGGTTWWLQAASPAARPVTTGAATSSAPLSQASTTTPTVAAPSVTPSVVTVNTPTPVVATVYIPETTVVGVNLLRVNPNGTSTIVATMIDNGQSGDQTAGDKVFTARLTLSEPQAGEVKFQVSAAFRGMLRRAQSPLATLSVWNSTSTGIGVTASYPLGWTVQGLGTGDPSIVITNNASPGPLTNASLTTNSFFQIRLLGPTPGQLNALPANPNSLPVTQWFATYFATGFSVPPSSQSVISVAGRQAVTVELAEAGGMRAHIYLPRGQDVFEVSYGLFAPVFVPTYEAILNSIQF